ncbi:MAG: hypothetical protein WB771_07250, partial [Solirubrobacterales bacterium]
ALIIAVAGGGTALAVAIHSSKKSDINKKGNIRVGRVTAKKLANGNVTAAKLAGIDVVQGSDTTTGGLAFCPPGELLLSGGAELTGSSTGTILVSAPEGNGWHARRSGLGLKVYALCLKASP